MVAFSQLLDLWAGADSDERSRLAASLFQYLVIDLDEEQIVDFRLHAWADQYLCPCAELYNEDNTVAFGDLTDDELGEGNENRFISVESHEAILEPNGTSGRKTVYERLAVAKRKVLVVIRLHFPMVAESNYLRDTILKARHAAGETLSSLAREFGLTPQRVFQIVKCIN